MMVEEDETIEFAKPNFGFNAFVATERGFVKGINYAPEMPLCKNFFCDKEKDMGTRITALSWKSKDQNELLVGYDNGKLATLNRTSLFMTQLQHLDIKSLMVAVHPVSDTSYLYGLENGKLCLYDTEKDDVTIEAQTGRHLSVVRQLNYQSPIFAGGGEENDLKIYDVNANQLAEPIFKARNVRHDFLELRVPVWVQDLTYVNESAEKIATCSRHGQVRLYDVKASSRPVIDFVVLDDEGLMSISDTGLGQVVVGGNKGTMAMVDLRQAGKGKLAHKFSPATGSIRSIHFKNNYILASSLDRHVYLYRLHEKQVQKKLYMRTRLTQVLMADDFSFAVEEAPDKKLRRKGSAAVGGAKKKKVVN